MQCHVKTYLFQLYSLLSQLSPWLRLVKGFITTRSGLGVDKACSGGKRRGLS